MQSIDTKRAREKQVVAQMITVYCHGQHHTTSLCPDCVALLAYANARSDNCPFMAQKTFCSNCAVHCYRAEMRTKIRAVMRYAGPRMLLHHPLLAISHMLETRKEKKRLEKTKCLK